MMRVLCDNCGATYKIPEEKLRKEVNKATCRKCGHRMLIRREAAATAAASPPPAPGDADESTQVTSAAEMERAAREHHAAVAANSGGMRIPTGATLPPSPAPSARDRWGGSTGADRQGEWGAPQGPSASIAPRDAPRPAPAVPRTDRATTPSMTPPPMVPQPVRPVRAQPEIRPEARSDGRPDSPPLAQNAFRSHDPAGDLTIALIGGFVAMLGALVLAVNLDGGPAQRFVGLLLALWGSLVAVLVVVTGRRGRRKAGVVVSIMLASFLSVSGAGVVAVASGLDSLRDGGLAAIDSLSRKGTAPAAPPTPTDDSVDATIEKLLAEEAPATAEDATTDAIAEVGTPAAEEEMVEGDAVAEEEPAAAEEPEDPVIDPEPKERSPATSARSGSTSSDSRAASTAPASGTGADVASSGSSSRSSESPSSRTSGSDASSRSSSSSPASTARSTAPADEPSSSSPPPKSTMDTLPLTVVDTIIRNNKGIKRCFLMEKQRSGTLPSKVNVRFTVLNSGSVSSAAIAGGSYANTDLDSCLSSAFYDLKFPAFDGDALKMTYPFVL